jgi:putative aminopeptidase FrvX
MPGAATDRHKLLRNLLSLPTAPFAEHTVLEFVERFCRDRRIHDLSRDRVGNLLVHVRVGRRRIRRPVCITAHTDHPGFVVDRTLKKGRLRAHWHGGVPPEYFDGSPVRFFVDNHWVRGRIRSHTLAVRAGRERVDTVLVDINGEAPAGAIGMWDLPEPFIRGSRIHARACDDLVGVGAMLCCIDELVRKKKPGEAYFLFTRAEEVGFIGAIAAARAKTIPKQCYVVAMEASSERPFAKIGYGPILRVGDRATSFTPEATAHCYRIARELAANDKSFKYQRKLMDGGTCESSAYCTLGYEATGLCVALGNYHNVDAAKQRLSPEYIDLDDFDNVVKWFVALATTSHAYSGRDEMMHRQLRDLEKTYRIPLLHTVRQSRA